LRSVQLFHNHVMPELNNIDRTHTAKD
jgi:hypothetical protein